MASAFSNGFKFGTDIADDADRSKRAREELDLKKERARRENALLDEQITGARRQTRINQQLDDDAAGIRTTINGGFVPGDNGASDDSAAMYGVPAGSTVAAPMDPSNLDQVAGLNRRIMGSAALKGDYNTVLQLQQRNKDLAEQQVFNNAVKQFSMNPDSFTEYARWVNKTNPLITAAPAVDPKTGQLTGYNIMTVGPAGDATHKFISPAQAAQLAGATALMQHNPTKALEIIGSVDTGLAQTIGNLNAAQEKVNTTNNNATHFANTDQTNRITAEAHMRTAKAAEARAAQEKKSPADQAQEKIEMYAGILKQQDPNLSDENARKKAADIILRDPNAKENDAGLAEAGIVKIQGKYFKQGKGGKLEAVQLPGQDATTEALRKLAAGGKDPFAKPEPKKAPAAAPAAGGPGISVRPPMTFDNSRPDPNYPGGRPQFNWSLPSAAPVQGVDPEVYKRNRPY